MPAAMLAGLALAACGNRQAEIVWELFAEKRALECRMEHLKQQNDSLWDEVAASLDQTLPAGMKADERRNMIQVRNTGLIMMFQSFPSLDTAIQNKVMEAGEQDKKIADEMRAVMEQLAAAEQRLNAALEELENKNQKKYDQIRPQLLEREKAPCG